METFLPILKHTALFSAMSEEEILSILRCMNAKIKVYSKGSYILRAGNSTESMGILVMGSALILQEDIWGHRNILDILSPGDSFGEIFAASIGSVLNCSVVTQAESSVLILNINRILSTCPNTCVHHSQLIRNLLSVIAGKSLRMNSKVSHLSKRSTKEKLMSYLSSEADKNNSLTFTIPYNRQQLADYLCVDRAAMSVALAQLQKEGVLCYRKNEFTLYAHIPES